MSGATLPQTALVNHPQHCASELERLFAACFGVSHNTRLQGGADEPVYRAMSGEGGAVIHYRYDYFRSALHEVAHWCVAGEARRRQDDYGYWYAPDGRSADQQREFERVEVLPQAWELLFCAAAGMPFRVSMDNLGNTPASVGEFERAVVCRAETLRRLESTKESVRSRGWRFTLALAEAFRGTVGFRREWLAENFRTW